MHIALRHEVNLLGAWALSVAEVVRAAVEAEAESAGGSPAALVAVVAEPGLSIEQLRHALDLSHPGTVRLVDRLEFRGLLVREPAQGRRVALIATGQGRRVVKRILQARERALEHALSALDRRQLEIVASCLEPMLAVTDAASLRRLCRLCDREACAPCPAWESCSRHEST